MSRASTESWVARLRLLDDLPLERGGRDLFGLGPLVELLVDTIARTQGPLVIHVDGSWGRGKTSFCRLVETKLDNWKADEGERGRGQSHTVRCARYVASDEEGDGIASLFHAIAKAIAGAKDPEEAARIVRQWGWSKDEPLDGMRLDGFSTWLRHELGRSDFEPRAEAVKIPLHPARADGGGHIELTLRPNPQRSAVVFVDDLDRCQRPRVVELLEMIRRFVACPGLVFVIAADRQLIQQAFEDIVERDADLARTSAAEAMEKYIHRRVELPGFSSFERSDLARVLEPLQQGLVEGGPGLRLLGMPSADFASGIALPLVQTLRGSLTPRRLKRILNDFAMDMATFVDRERRASAFSSEDEWRKAWKSPETGFEPAYESGGASLPAYFIGRLLVRVCEHLWPSLLAPFAPGDDAFRKRSGRLLALARAHEDFEGSVDGEMLDELLMGLDPGRSTPLRVRRQLLELFAWVEQARREWAVFEREPTKQRAKGGALLRETAMNAAEAIRHSKGAALESLRGQADSVRERRKRGAKRTEVMRGGALRAAPQEEATRGAGEASRSSETPREALSEALSGILEDAERLLERIDEPEARAELFVKLELLLDAGELAPDRVFALLMEVEEVAVVRGLLEGELVELLALAELAAARGLSPHARRLFGMCEGLLVVDDVALRLRWAASYLGFVVVHDEAMLAAMETHRVFRTVEDVLVEAPERAEVYAWQMWLAAAGLRARLPSVEGPWFSEYVAYREDLAHLYATKGGREITRRYVMLLRAEGGDDPALDELTRNRATLVSASKGDPDIIQAYADILVNRADPGAYYFARRLYLRLQGTPQWTPQVMHNLATAISALEPNEDGVGELWIEAHRRAPEDLVIRRALTRFLRGRGQREQAIAVSRGETLREDFNPYDASHLLEREEPQP